MRSRRSAGASSASSRSCESTGGQRVERQRRLGPREPLRPPLRQLGPGEAEQQHAARLRAGRRGARSGRGRSPRPSGRRRTPRRAAARGRAPRRASASRRRPRSSSLRARSRRGRPAGTSRGSARTSSPSPYGGQIADHDLASSSSERRSSRASRDLPMPESPTTVTRRTPDEATSRVGGSQVLELLLAARRAGCRRGAGWPSPSGRPTRAGTRPSPAAFPFSVSGSSGVARTACSTRR